MIQMNRFTKQKQSCRYGKHMVIKGDRHKAIILQLKINFKRDSQQGPAV